jgi:hypothetical protein
LDPNHRSHPRAATRCGADGHVDPTGRAFAVAGAQGARDGTQNPCRCAARADRLSGRCWMSPMRSRSGAIWTPAWSLQPPSPCLRTARGVRVYFEASQGPYGASEASFIGQTLARLGARQYSAGRSGPVSEDQSGVCRACQPRCHHAQRRRAPTGWIQRPGWHNIRALREQRVCIFTAEQADVPGAGRYPPGRRGAADGQVPAQARRPPSRASWDTPMSAAITSARRADGAGWR